MRRPNVLRPVVELFSDGEILDVNMLHRNGAFRRPMIYPFRRLRTFPDRVEISFPKTDYWNRPPQIILIERTAMHFGGTRPWFICSHCSRRRAMLYVTSIDVRCRVCSDLQWQCQRQRRKAKLIAKAEKIRNRLWTENGKPARPFQMHKRTFRQHLHALQVIEHAIRTGSRISSPRLRRYRERDEAGRYCD